MGYVLLPVKLALVLAVLTGLYFLLVTRGSLVIRSLTGALDSTSHIYLVYTNRFLIWLTDRPLVVSAILLFNYSRLVNDVVARLNPSLKGCSVLQVSCAFGDISRKIVEKCVREDARRIVILDLIPNEIRHTKKALGKAGAEAKCFFAVEDAVNIAHKDETFDYVVLFFLFHELPLEKKTLVLLEAARVLKPGGKIIFSEFHRPGPWMLRASGRVFFKVFEPYALEMWGLFDPAKVLEGGFPGRWEFSKSTCFGGNYQVFSARKAL